MASVGLSSALPGPHRLRLAHLESAEYPEPGWGLAVPARDCRAADFAAGGKDTQKSRLTRALLSGGTAKQRCELELRRHLREGSARGERQVHPQRPAQVRQGGLGDGEAGKKENGVAQQSMLWESSAPVHGAHVRPLSGATRWATGPSKRQLILRNYVVPFIKA